MICRHDIVNCSQKFLFQRSCFCIGYMYPWTLGFHELQVMLYGQHILCPLSSLWFINFNSEPLPTFSVLPDPWNEDDNLCWVSLAALPFLWNLMLSQWWCCQFYWLFFILNALSKGKGQWNAWPQCNTLLWGAGCWVKWHLGQHCSMPRKEQKLFSLANLQSVKLPLAPLLDSGGQCLYFILLRWLCLELGTRQVPHLTL